MDDKLEAVVVPVSDVDRAEAKYEEATGRPDPDWPGWYARYMVDESSRQDAGT